ncbi:unnamed protein product [Ambrosiozyma monospora]|uniref:Unnamed protein product n=1 Tax=Ambrosiozyma monospora TaxID=43982 RepID=A0ACB5U3G2_AMBMO|nr:unnamed protein product [Ambrosiozyma monospora]
MEIGCLSSQNEISKCKIFQSVTKLDLHSQEPGVIEEQDFMERPIPKTDTSRFDLISCSLVVNFVPDAEARGEMLRRITKFFKTGDNGDGWPKMLFFVLPLPCITNSRYCDDASFGRIMGKLGFVEVKKHTSNKLAYWLFEYDSKRRDLKFTVRKKELHPGGNRNNFCVVLS